MRALARLALRLLGDVAGWWHCGVIPKPDGSWPTWQGDTPEDSEFAARVDRERREWWRNHDPR